MTGSSYNNGGSESRSYNNDNTLASISFSGASIGNMSYSWDANKNKTAESISGTMSNYGFTIPSGGYDAEDRLVEYKRTSGLDQSWDLSLVGDWNSITTNTVAQNRTHGPTHELFSVQFPLPSGEGQGEGLVTHDVKGNMTLIPAAARANAQALALSWDFDNRMTGADVGNNSTINVSQQYDALGRRVARTESSTTTVFVQSGQQTIADYAAGAAPASSTFRYVYASYIDEPVMRWQTSGGALRYYHRNQQYSIIALTDGSGSIVERYAYTAYGRPTITDASGTLRTTSAHANRYTYTSREWDETAELYHYRARMYDPQLGRFLGRDPIGFRGSRYSAYEYVEGDPLKRKDFSGLASLIGTHTDLVFGLIAEPCRFAQGINQQFVVSSDNHSGGWMVQELTIMCEIASCPCSRDSLSPKKAFTIYEAFRVLPGNTRSGTDRWRIPAPRKSTCGTISMSGRAAFFLSDDIESAFENSLPPGSDEDEVILGEGFDPISSWTNQEMDVCGIAWGVGRSPTPANSLPEWFSGVPRQGGYINRSWTRTWEYCCDRCVDLTTLSGFGR